MSDFDPEIHLLRRLFLTFGFVVASIVYFNRGDPTLGWTFAALALVV